MAKKRVALAILLSSCLLVGLLTGCSKKQANEANDGTSSTTRVLKMGHHLSDTDGNNQMAQKFAELVEKKTDGRYKIEIYTNGQLGGQKECLESLKTGTLDMSISDTGLLANYVSSIGLLDLPYMFDSREQARKIMDGVIGTEIKEQVAKESGIRPLTIEGVLFRDTLLNNKKALSPADFKGIKIRTPENPVITMTFQAFGATPVAIPSGEVYSAMQTGIVDGLEGNAEFVTLSKYFEVAKTCLKTGHILTNTTMNISEKVWQEISAEDQQKFIEAGKEALDFFYPLYDKIASDSEQTMKQAGVEFIEVDKDPFKQAVKPAVEDYVQKNNLQDLYQKLKQSKGE